MARGEVRAPCALPAALFLALYLTAGCGAPDRESSPIVMRDSAGITIVDNDLTRLTARCTMDAAPSVLIGTADGDPDYELYRVFGASRLSDGRIVLVNQGSQELRFYDPDGQYLMSAGRSGEGPGEFRDAYHVWVLPGDTIWVGDYRPWQFLVFAPDGQWVRTVQPRPVYPNPPGVISVLDDGRSVLADRGRSEGERGFELLHLTPVVHGPDGMLLDTVGTFPNGRWGRMGEGPGSISLYPLFESFTRITAAGSRIVTGHGSTPELTILDAAHALRPERIVRWTTAPRTIRGEHVEAERRRIAAQYEDMDPDMRERLVDPLISEDRPVADKFPAFSRVALGRDGRIWVREFQKPGETGASEWLAFGSDGAFECHLAIPPFDEVLEFGSDYILAEDPDGLGVERIVLYWFGPPAGG